MFNVLFKTIYVIENSLFKIIEDIYCTGFFCAILEFRERRL